MSLPHTASLPSAGGPRGGSPCAAGPPKRLRASWGVLQAPAGRPGGCHRRQMARGSYPLSVYKPCPSSCPSMTPDYSYMAREQGWELAGVLPASWGG